MKAPICELKTNFVQSVCKSVLSTWGKSNHLPVVDDELVTVRRVFALWNSLESSNELNG
jgi:hypothetical protein